MPRCDDCRTPMTQGYVIDAGTLHYCEPCHTKRYTPVTCPYCEGCGEGTYWVHSLESTISTTCHGCDGRGEVSRERAKDLESDTKSL